MDNKVLTRIAIGLSVASFLSVVAVFVALPVESSDDAYDAFRSTEVYRNAVAADRGVRVHDAEPDYVAPADSTGESDSDTIIIDTTELDCLHKNVYWEGRNQSLDGKIAIATVTLNRAKSHKFGDTICEVVYDARKDANGQILRHKCQFSWYCDGLKDEPNLANAVERKAWRKAREVAEGVMLGEYYANQLNADTLYYHAVSVKPYWAARKVKVARVGGHIFYRDRFKSRKS